MTEVQRQQISQIPQIPALNASRSLGADITSKSEPIRLMGAAPTPSSCTAPTQPQKEQQTQINKQNKDNIDRSGSNTKITPTPSDESNENESIEIHEMNDESNTDDSINGADQQQEEEAPTNNPTLPFSSLSGPAFKFLNASSFKSKIPNPELLRTKSCPEMKYDDCREFDSFAGEWIDSKGQNVLISPWGVIRYPNNPKLRFEATYMGPNHLSVTFDKDPKRRKFVGKLNHECTLLIWSNDTKWAKKGCKHDPRFQNTNKNKRKNSNGNRNRNASCLIQ